MRFYILFCVMCFIPSLFSIEKEDKVERVYVQPTQIAVQQNQILVLGNNQWQPIDALFSDSNGVYFLSKKWYEPWECAYCQAINPPHRLICWNCGR
jgi:hypothetical protein